jgi:transcriptional regulator with XRE-family HTH domain
MVGRYPDRDRFPDTLAGRLGYNLRRLRIQAGLSGREVAEAAGWQKTTWYRFEDGRASTPSLGDLERAARVLGVDPSQFFRRVPKRHREAP